MPYDELLVALENIVMDKVATVPTASNRTIDSSEDDGEKLRE